MEKSFQKEVKESVEVLNNGGIILYPTDTIWGIGCDATNEIAVENIYNIKKRDKHKSMLILVNSVQMMEKYVKSVPEEAYDLIEISKHPLTIIYPRGINLADNLLADDGSIGIRIVKDEFCKELIEEFGKPIVSTSANLAGTKPPLGYFDISNEIKMNVDYIVPLRLEEFSTTKSSDIIKVNSSGKIEIIR
ncbi:MAG: threonylcarbamoyl-AMP synthase [Bacteroidales bacterium]|jgi:L-threonylcarbamoyladenylate synthase|nr:threonylcarbamoyl-AMP synthase [Bacteroidales bacterium]